MWLFNKKRTREIKEVDDIKKLQGLVAFLDSRYTSLNDLLKKMSTTISWNEREVKRLKSRVYKLEEPRRMLDQLRK